MNKKAKHSILTVIIYTIFTYIILTPLKTWVINIPISILVGCLFSILNDILSEIRKLNNKNG